MDIISQRFWKLVVISLVKIIKWERYRLCKCDCWKEHITAWNSLKRSRTRSCWCLHIGRPKHNLVYSRIYSIWRNMNSRCRNKSYKNYWWRWIKCLRKNFEEFYKDMWSAYKEWLTLDRIDSNWNYYKENCRRTTQKEQMNNTKRNRNITYNWKTQNISQRSDELWINRNTLYRRLYKWKQVHDLLKNK